MADYLDDNLFEMIKHSFLILKIGSYEYCIESIFPVKSNINKECIVCH